MNSPPSDPPIKVGIVCPYDLGRHGGVQDQCFKLAGGLTDHGHEAVVVGPGEAPDGAISVGPVRVVSANGSTTPISADMRVRARIETALAGSDVLHIHEPFMPAVSVAATRIEGVAKVGTFHADPPGWVRGAYRLGRPVLRKMAGRLDVVTAVSSVAAGAMEGLGAPRIIPNGIDVDAFTPGPKLEGSVGFIGRDDPRKGLDVLLEAWEIVRGAMPNVSLEVISPDRTGEVDGVSFLGSATEQEKIDFLARTRMLITPNLGGESFGIVVAEGMAAGCTVVASAIPAFVNVLGNAGALTKPGDAAGLAQVVIALCDDPNEAARLGALARKRVRRFDMPAVLAGYMVAYRNAVRRRAEAA